MARARQRRSGGARPDAGAQRRPAPRPTEQGIIPVLAEVAGQVDRAVQRPPMRPADRTKFQVVALLMREERARVMADSTLGESGRAKQLKRLDGVATQLARTAARDTSLLQLLADDARVSDAARAYKATLMRAGGLEPPEEPAPVEAGRAGARRRARGAAVGDLAPAREPVPGPGLRGRGRADRHAGPPAGRLGAARTAVPLLRAGRHRRTRLHGPARAPPGAHARRPGADAAPGPGRRPRRPSGTARSCSPTSPGSARRPRRCSPPRPPTPTRCWSSCPTSSRRTGRTRWGCGRRSAGPPWCTATVTGWTGSRTS